MRVTETIATRDFLSQVSGIKERMLEAQNKVSTGRALLRPSEDPRGASDVLRLRALDSESLQFERNLEYGKSQLEFTDTVLDSLQNMVERVRFLALSAIGSSTSTDTYSAEVEGLRDQILGTANSSFQGRFIFAGSATETLPYTKDGAGVVTYQGNTDTSEIQVGRNTKLQVNVKGGDLFGSGNDMFLALSELITAMQSGVKSDIDAKLKGIENAWDGISVNRSRIGGLVNVAESVASEMSALSIARAGSLSDLEEADLTKSLTEFKAYENALQSTLAVGARISQLTLLDYLR